MLLIAACFITETCPCKMQRFMIAAHSAYEMFSWYQYLIVGLVFSHLGFWSGNLFLIAPFPDLCLLVHFLRWRFERIYGQRLGFSVHARDMFFFVRQVTTLGSFPFKSTHLETYKGKK